MPKTRVGKMQNAKTTKNQNVELHNLTNKILIKKENQKTHK